MKLKGNLNEMECLPLLADFSGHSSSLFLIDELDFCLQVYQINPKTIIIPVVKIKNGTIQFI